MKTEMVSWLNYIFNKQEKSFFRVIDGEFEYARGGQWVRGLPGVQRQDRATLLSELSLIG